MNDACKLADKDRLFDNERYAFAWGWERGYKTAKRDMRK
jgi:hypothetical protein